MLVVRQYSLRVQAARILAYLQDSFLRGILAQRTGRAAEVISVTEGSGGVAEEWATQEWVMGHLLTWYWEAGTYRAFNSGNVGLWWRLVQVSLISHHRRLEAERIVHRERKRRVGR